MNDTKYSRKLYQSSFIKTCINSYYIIISKIKFTDFILLLYFCLKYIILPIKINNYVFSIYLLLITFTSLNLLYLK